MAVYYCDSSAIVKRYIFEPGSRWMGSLVLPASGNLIVVSLLAGPETVAAFFKLARTGAISAADAVVARIVFEHHLAAEYPIVDVTRSIAQSAMVLAERYGLRGYDAVQLASALEVHAARSAVGLPALTFVSADDRLNNAAQAEGISVKNPNRFP